MILLYLNFDLKYSGTPVFNVSLPSDNTDSYQYIFNNILFKYLSATIFNSNAFNNNVQVIFNNCIFTESSVSIRDQVFTFSGSRLEFYNCSLINMRYIFNQVH